MTGRKTCRCTGAATLIFACSGAADVGEIADRTARKLTRTGAGKMYCLTGIGGRVASIVKTAQVADTILAIDGCVQNCASHCLEEAGFTKFKTLRLANLGMDKGMTTVNEKAVVRAAAAARVLLAS